MGATLLVSSPNSSWREWLKTHRSDKDVLCLDPADPTFGQPCRFSLNRRERPIWERFYGSLDSSRAPHVLIAALIQGQAQMADSGYILLPSYRNTPVLRQTLQILLDLAEVDRVLVPAGFDPKGFRWKVESEPIELEKSLPTAVQNAQRKAQWISLQERCQDHVVDLRETLLEGGRFGSGTPVDEHQKAKLHLEGAYVEVVGTSLFIVTDNEFEDGVVTRAMDYTHTVRANFASPSLFEGVLCAFSKQSGEDFGFGFVESIDFLNLRAKVKCTAIPPVPVRSLRIGSLRIDEKCNEIGEVKPWQI